MGNKLKKKKNKKKRLQAKGSTPIEVHIDWKFCLKVSSFLMSFLYFLANISNCSLNCTI